MGREILYLNHSQRARLECTFIDSEGLMQSDFKNQELIEFLRNCEYSDQEIAKILSRVRDYDASMSRRALEEEEWAKAKRH